MANEVSLMHVLIGRRRTSYRGDEITEGKPGGGWRAPTVGSVGSRGDTVEMGGVGVVSRSAKRGCAIGRHVGLRLSGIGKQAEVAEGGPIGIHASGGEDDKRQGAVVMLLKTMRLRSSKDARGGVVGRKSGGGPQRASGGRRGDAEQCRWIEHRWDAEPVLVTCFPGEENSLELCSDTKLH